MRWIHLDVNMIRLSHVKYIFQLWIELDSENDTKSEYGFMHIRVMCMLRTTQKDISGQHQSVYNWSPWLAMWTGIQWKSGVPCSNTMHPTWSAGGCWFTLTVWTCLIALLLVSLSVGLLSDFWITSSSVLCKIPQRTSCFCKITSSFIEGYLRTMPVINQNHLFGFFENHHTYFRPAVRTSRCQCLPKTGSPSRDPVFFPSHLQIVSFRLFPFFNFYHLWYPPKTGSLSTGSFHFVSCHRSPNQSRAAAAVQLRAAKLGGRKGQLSSWLELWFCGQQITLACCRWIAAALKFWNQLLQLLVSVGGVRRQRVVVWSRGLVCRGKI